MRAVVQRISEGRVDVDGKVVGQCGKGLLVYISVGKGETTEDAKFIADKLVNLRIFEDEEGRMNRSVLDVGGEILLVSNFTLHGDCRKGRRPSFDAAAEPESANELYEKTIKFIEQNGVRTARGVFAAHMHVSCINDGPVTVLLDSSKLF